MDVSKIKIGGIILGGAAALAAVFFGLQSGGNEPSKELSDRLYKITFVGTTTDGAGQTTPVVNLEGTLSLAKDGDREYQAQWLSFQKLDLGGAKQDTSGLTEMKFLAKLTNHRVQLFNEGELPAALGQINLGVMDKIIPPFTPSQLAEPKILAHTSDWGSAQVEFTAVKEGEISKVLRAYKKSSKNEFAFDQDRSSIEYTFDAKGEMQSVRGEIVSKHLENGQVLHVKIAMTSTGEKSPAPVQKIAEESLTKFDSRRAFAASVDRKQRAETLGLSSFDEVVEKLNTLPLEEISAQYMPMMQSLIYELYDDPSLAKKLGELAAKASDGTDLGEKKVTLLMASIASSDDSSASEVLAGLAQSECPNTYCKDQALMAYAMHQVPTVESAKKVLDIAQTSTDPEISGTAYLAAGSAGNVLGEDFQELAPSLNSALQGSTEDSTLRRNVIHAMGNHGDSAYLPTLSEELKSEEPWHRGAAVSSLRYLPGSEVNGIIVQTFEKDKDTSVLLDALSAMDARALDQADYERVAQHSLKVKQDVQESSASVLVNAGLFFGVDTTESLRKLGSGTKFPEVKAIVDEGLTRIAKFKETGDWSEDDVPVVESDEDADESETIDPVEDGASE